MSGALSFTPIQVPDFSQTLARAQGMQANRLAMLALQRQMDQDDQLNAAIQTHSAALGSGDQMARLNALTALAQSGPRGLQVALPLIQGLRQEMDFFGQGGATASPGAPAMAPAPGGSSGDPALPRGLRNNNPLNLGFVEGQPGVLGSDGRFGRYATPEEGIAAGVRQLQLYAQRGVTNLRDIIARWAPPSENNTGRYIAAVAQATGLRPDQPVNLSDPAVVTRLVAAMAQMENGRPLDPAVAERGVQLALGGGGTEPRAIPTQAVPPGSSPTSPDSLPAVPGFDMNLVRRAMTMPNNPTAANYLRNYMAAAQLMQRGEPPAPVEVADPSSPTGRRYVPRGQAAGMPAPGPQPDPTAAPFNRENTLRDEFNTLSRDFRTVQTAWENIQSAARSSSGAGDMSMLYAYVRMLDPTSVVRESEFAAAAASGSFGERVQGAVQRVLSGERLPDTLRNSFLSEARNIYNNNRRPYDRLERHYREIARRNNLNPDNIIAPFATPDVEPEPQPPAAPGIPGPGGRGTAEPPPSPGVTPPPGFRVVR